MVWRECFKIIYKYFSSILIVLLALGHTIDQFVEYFSAERNISVSREISKMFEETVRGTAAEVVLYFEQKKPKGEFVIVVAGKK